MLTFNKQLEDELFSHLTDIISETNGITLIDTLELLNNWLTLDKNERIGPFVQDFRNLLTRFQQDLCDIDTLLAHPFSKCLFRFFKNFPLPYTEEHIHLTGSLSAEFIYPRLLPLLEGPNRELYAEKIKAVYGPESLPIKSVADVDRLLRLKGEERFARYLKILFLPKLVLTSRKAHAEAAFHMAHELYYKYNVGKLRLKFTLSRSSLLADEQIPGTENLTAEDVVLGLFDGFVEFKNKHPQFDFILSPSFRKEPHFFDSQKYSSKREHFLAQIELLLDLLNKHQFLRKYLCEVDTVGDERDLYRKGDFNEMNTGFRRLQFQGFKVRSHHGETWHTLRKGIQAVDNAMNIWRIDTLEHGLSLGINPNYYFHSLFQRLATWNRDGVSVRPDSLEYKELCDMNWMGREHICTKLLAGERLSPTEFSHFIKTKFHTAREVENYQHDVLNRMIHKEISLVALPSSNTRLTSLFKDIKDHPFSWWEKKGVKLGVGTDNYVTLNTNFIQEMLILLYTDPFDLKITKLLMITTGETRRPYLSNLYWQMKKQVSTMINLGEL